MFILYNQETNEIQVSYGDLSYVPNHLIDQVIEVSEFPNPPSEKVGISFVPMFKPDTQTVYYKEVSRPLTMDEQVEKQSKMIADLTYQLMMKGVL